MKTLDQKVDDATHAALQALGLSAERNPDTADLLNSAIASIAQNVVTDDEEGE